MKKIFIYTAILIAGLTGFSSCGSDIELPVLTEDDYPRILGQWPQRNGDILGEFGGLVGVEITVSA
ncbi:MAG: hypothetical protein LBS79_06015, partial [Tannerella sp.]|nr:hypothetical protein [Tannerella sp.]